MLAFCLINFLLLFQLLSHSCLQTILRVLSMIAYQMSWSIVIAFEVFSISLRLLAWLNPDREPYYLTKDYEILCEFNEVYQLYKFLALIWDFIYSRILNIGLLSGSILMCFLNNLM